MTSFNVSFKFLIFYQALGESFQRKELYLQTNREGRAFVIVLVVVVVRLVFVITISIFSRIAEDSKVMC